MKALTETCQAQGTFYLCQEEAYEQKPITWFVSTRWRHFRFDTHLKELCHDILSHFFDGLSHGLSVGKPKTNDLLMKEKTKGVILKQKGTRMAEDGEDWNGLEMTILKSLANFSRCTNDDVAPLRVIVSPNYWCLCYPALDWLYCPGGPPSLLPSFHILLDVVRGSTALFLSCESCWSGCWSTHQIILLSRMG